MFAHGWARSHHDFIPAAESLGALDTVVALDLPGFGATPRPDEAWDTARYADHVAGIPQDRQTSGRSSLSAIPSVAASGCDSPCTIPS